MAISSEINISLKIINEFIIKDSSNSKKIYIENFPNKKIKDKYLNKKYTN
mgnify:CR=1 FL=1